MLLLSLKSLLSLTSDKEKELMTKDKCSEDEEKEDGGDDNDEVLMNGESSNTHNV